MNNRITSCSVTPFYANILLILVKFEYLCLRSTEFAVQICEPNNNEIRRLEKKLWQKSTYFLNDHRIRNYMYNQGFGFV